MWILELQNDSEMLNVSLRRPPFHTCSSNKDPLSHIYFLPWILSQLDIQLPNRESSFFFFFRCMYGRKLPTQDFCFLIFELVILLFKSLSILFCPNYNRANANQSIINTSRDAACRPTFPFQRAASLILSDSVF